jgi:transcription elongation GreA/GreB family factor
LSEKKTVHSVLSELVTARLDTLQYNLNDLKTSAANETKSTAGDKYETALAMLQAEQVIVSNQIQQTMEQLTLVKTLDYHLINESVVTGSLVETETSYFYLSTAVGKLMVLNSKPVFAISELSPLGKILKGCKQNDTIILNNFKHRIIELS